MSRRNPAPDPSAWTEMVEMNRGKTWTLIWVSDIVPEGYRVVRSRIAKARAYVLFREVTGKYVTMWFCHDSVSVATSRGWKVGVPRNMPHQECVYVDEKHQPAAEELREMGMNSYFVMQQMVERIRELDAT